MKPKLCCVCGEEICDDEASAFDAVRAGQGIEGLAPFGGLAGVDVGGAERSAGMGPCQTAQRVSH